MSDPPKDVAGDTASKWNARYAFAGPGVPPAAEVLTRHSRWLPTRADDGAAGAPLDALDLACGLAGNGEWLGARGFRVTAWDLSEKAIAAVRARPGSRVARAAVRDVVREPPAPRSFDAVVVARFLDRSLCPAIAEALRPGGVLFYQTFTAGLSNPDFLLGPNELLDLFPTLSVCAYREPLPPTGPEGRAEAMLVGRRDRL